MRLRNQLLGGALLAGVTCLGVLRIAEAKNEAVAGRGVYRLDERRRDEMLAFGELRRQLESMGQSGLAERLETLRLEGELWIAPALDPGRWAVHVDTFSLVRRIYMRRQALLSPRAHLYPEPRPEIPDLYQIAFARLSLAGALYHELCHHDGVLDEGEAYAREIAWYQALGASGFLDRLSDEERPVWEWALEAAVKSAEKARARAGS